MPLTIEVLPDPAAHDQRLLELAAQRSAPLERLNILHGSGLQRLAVQRRLTAAHGGALAAVYGFTPVDLAHAAAQLGDPPERTTWPPGADLAALQRLLTDQPLTHLRPDAPGVASALLRTLTDLREAALTPDALPSGELRTVFTAWRELVASAADRSARYEDAVSAATPDAAFRAALGGAPLIVSGIYDLTRIQRLLLARAAASVEVLMLLVAPSDDPAAPPQRTLTALRRELGARVQRSALPPAPPVPEHYFSVVDPTAEADEIARRILQLGHDGVAFHRVAILHQQGAPADDRLVAALERAGLPSWRIGGRALASAPLGSAVQTLIRILLQPSAVERASLLDWLAHRALAARPLKTALNRRGWDVLALDAGLTVGLHEMREQLDRWRAATRAADGADLAELLTDLSERSRALADADSWRDAAQLLLDAVDAYIADRPEQAEHTALRRAARDTIEQLAAHDALGAAWSPRDGSTALQRALGARVVRDPQRLVGGVNIGAATGPARLIRYDAIFAAGAAERVFPAVGRQDPLLTDDERAAINARIPDALALQRERADSDRAAWQLMRGAARRAFTASWSRRSSAVGAPARASTFILEAAAAALDPAAAYSEQTLSEHGQIERIPSSGAAEPQTPATADAVDAVSLDLAILSTPDVDAAAVLPQLWSGAAPARHARQRRSESAFTEFDGQLHADQLDHWQPLAQSWSAAALETYVECPYRFYLRYIIGAAAPDAAGQPDQTRRAALARLLRRILATWAREYEHVKTDRTWFEYCDSPGYLNTTARRILDAVADSGLLGPPAAVPAARGELLRDLDRARRREAADARAGWRPLLVNHAFDDAPIRAPGQRTLRLRGLIDRIDVGAGGRQRALSFSTAQTLPDVRGFVNGSSFAAIASLAALTQRGVPIRDAAVEHRSVSRRGGFESQTLLGESLTTHGGPSAPSDGERLSRTLGVLTDQLEAARFIPHPGEPAYERPNCAQCPYESACTPDVAQRIAHKQRRNPDATRALHTLRRQRL